MTGNRGGPAGAQLPAGSLLLERPTNLQISGSMTALIPYVIFPEQERMGEPLGLGAANW